MRIAGLTVSRYGSASGMRAMTTYSVQEGWIAFVEKLSSISYVHCLALDIIIALAFALRHVVVILVQVLLSSAVITWRCSTASQKASWQAFGLDENLAATPPNSPCNS